MCLLTFQMFGNRLLSVSSKQVVRLEKGTEVTAGGEHAGPWTLGREAILQPGLFNQREEYWR